MLKNLFLGMFQLIAAAALLVNLVLPYSWSQSLHLIPLSIAVSPVEQLLLATSTTPVTSTNPQPTGASTATDQDKESADPSIQRRTDQNSAQDSTLTQDQGKDQSEPAAPYDMEAIKAFNRALYGS